jgi:hypothetical protein
MSARADYLKWRREPAVGCRFARWLSNHPNDYGQQIEEVSRSGNPMRIAAAIVSRVDRLVADPSISAATLLLPQIVNVEALANIALALRGRPQWNVTTSKLEPPPVGKNLVRVHIVRQLPFENTVRPSEVLVLGPFNIFPPTRRSPVTAFEIFVGKPMANDPGSGKPTDKTNLAHMDLSGSQLTPNAFDNLWNGSRAGRLASLGGVEDNRAKAKVSFVISATLAKKLLFDGQ